MNETEKTSPGQAQGTIATLFGGIDREVKKRDGTTEAIRIQQLPVRMFNQMLALQDDEPALVELYCGKPKGWADTLTMEDYNSVITAADSLNEAPFDSWLKRRLSRSEKLMPGFMEKIVGAALPSPTGLRK